MEGVVKVGSHCETLVEEYCYCLPQDLQEAYHPEVPVALWNKDYCLTGTLLFQSNIDKVRWDQKGNLMPVCCVWCFLTCFLLEPHMQVLHSHA